MIRRNHTKFVEITYLFETKQILSLSLFQLDSQLTYKFALYAACQISEIFYSRSLRTALVGDI